jgi:hypothetical protein
MTRPHDITDLYLAPVALSVDEELQYLRDLNEGEVLRHIVLATNREPRTVEERRAYFVEAMTHHHDMHGWIASYDPRGLRLTNGEHTLVLGVPSGVRSYLGPEVGVPAN